MKRTIASLAVTAALAAPLAAGADTILFGEAVERVLEPIEDAAENARSEFDGEQLPGELDLVADAATGGILENLHVSGMTPDAEDLSFEPLVADEDIADLIFRDGGPV